MEFDAWLNSSFGRRCVELEREVIRGVFEQIFGEQLLQIGIWGERDAFLPYARTQRAAIVGCRGSGSDLNGSDLTGADLVSDFERLSIASDSVDAVFLPHTLERSSSAHAVLREAARVLRADGHLVVLGFRPGGPWGLRHLFAAGGYPPGSLRLIRDGRLSDWLELLSFDVGKKSGYCHVPPFERIARVTGFPREAWARKWLPLSAAAYLLVARKQVARLTPLKPVWRRARLRAVQGLVKPTAGASRTRQAG